MAARSSDDFEDEVETAIAPKVERPSATAASYALVVVAGPDLGKSYLIAAGQPTRARRRWRPAQAPHPARRDSACMTKPLWIEPYLVELLRPMAEEGFPLIVAGGLGIYLKRRWVEQTRQQTLWTPLPDARATHDIDSFLALEIFQQDRVSRFRGTLARLGYQVHEKARYYQFIKPVTGVPVDHVKIDLHTRLPRDDEATQLKLQNHRLGRSGHRAFRTLHAWATPEAFAIDEGVQELPFAGSDPADIRFEGVVRVPHPFASLCMKLTAAGDHERTPIENRDPLQRKHAFDVFLLTAMLSESEVSQVRTSAARGPQSTP